MRFKIRNFAPRSSSRSGNAATLVAVVMIITVGGIMMAVNMAGEQGSDYNEKVRETQRRIQYIQTRVEADMAATGRLRRPANSTYAVPNPLRSESGTNYFGVEAVPTSDVNPASLPKLLLPPDVVTGKVLRGDPPLTSWNIDDPKYMFDAWGRRFVYLVQEDATDETSCRALQEDAAKNPLLAKINIRDFTGTVKDRAFYAIVSMGPDGQWATPMEGSTLAGRINVGNTDTDTVTNGVPSASQFRNVVVQKPRTATYDDISFYSEAYRRTCCLKTSCMANTVPQEGLKYIGVDMNDLAGFSQSRTIGDVNGDTIGDLVVGAPYANSGHGAVYVVFGTAMGFPNPLPLDSLDGSNGFKVTCAGCKMLGWFVNAQGDVNGDGVIDLAFSAKLPHSDQTVCPLPPGAGVYALFGKTTWPAEVVFTNVGGSWGPPGSSGFIFGGTALPVNFGYDGFISDINGDGIGDYAVSALNKVYVMAGHTGAFPVNPAYVDINDLIGIAQNEEPSLWKQVFAKSAVAAVATEGFVVTADANVSNNPNRPVPPTGTQNFAPSLATGDINHDGYFDIILGAPNITPPAPNDNARAGGAYVIFGNQWMGAEFKLADINGSNGFRIDGAITGAKLGASVTAGDVNGDGVEDVILGAPHSNLKLTYDSSGSVFCCTTAPGKVYVVYGAAGVWPTYMNVNTLNGTNGFMVSGSAINDNFGASIAVGDINGDGFTDMVVGAPTEGGATEGAAYVVYGKATFASLMDVTTPDGTNVSRVHGSLPGQTLGWAVSAGNLNGLLSADFAVSSPFANFGPGGFNSGGGYILFGPLSSSNIDAENL